MHGCKPAQGKADFIDCVNLDGWTCDFLCARRFGFDGGFNSRLGCGPIDSYRNLGVEKGMAEVMAVTANHFDDGFTRNGFGWVANCWEISLVENLNRKFWTASPAQRSVRVGQKNFISRELRPGAWWIRSDHAKWDKE